MEDKNTDSDDGQEEKKGGEEEEDRLDGERTPKSDMENQQ